MDEIATGKDRRKPRRAAPAIEVAAVAPVTAPTPASPPAPPAEPLRCRIEIEAATRGGFLDDRYDLTIRGRVAAMAPLASVKLETGGLVTGEIRYAEAPPAGAVPANLSIVQQFFIFVLSMPAAEREGPHPFTIVAQGTGGQLYREEYVVAVSGNSAEAQITNGPVQLPSGSWQARPPVFVHVERGEADGTGRISVQGWAVSLARLTEVRIEGGGAVLGAAQMGLEREDVARAVPIYPNARQSGFSFAGSVDVAVETITVRALTQDHISQAVMVPLARRVPPPLPVRSGPERLRNPRREIRLCCDNIRLAEDGHLTVDGWALSGIGISSMHIYLDDEMVGNAELGLPRRDVEQEYPDVPLARYAGFRFARPVTERTGGGHEVRVVAYNGLGDTAEELRTIEAQTVEPRPGKATPTIESGSAQLEEDSEFHCWLDSPRVNAGQAAEPITGRLTIEGWALARSGLKSVEVYLDGRLMGPAKYGMARRDVGETYPDWPNALRSGYIFTYPPRGLENGLHTVRVQANSLNGQSRHTEFRIEVKKSDRPDEDYEDYASIRRRMPLVEQLAYEDMLARLSAAPQFLLLVRGGQDAERLRATLLSLKTQIYAQWHALILDHSDAVHDPVAGYGARVSLLYPDRPLPEADLIGCISAGDELGCDALAEMAVAAGLHPKAGLFYADEDRISPATQAHEPFFKPAWSPDLLLSTNYIGRPWFARADVFTRAGVTPRSISEQGEFDALLRCTEAAGDIRHLPKLLCRREDLDIETAALELAALQNAAARRGILAEVLPGRAPGSYRFNRTAPAAGRVSVIIPTCAAHGHIKTCIAGLRGNTNYRDIEIICIDNIPPEKADWKAWLRDNCDKVIEIPESFNWSKFNNRAAALAKGSYLLFLNDDIEIIQPEWLDIMLAQAARPEVGVVGPRLLYPDRTVQHAGVFLTSASGARHAFRHLAEADPGYFGLSLTERDVIAVTGACMLIRRDLFETMGGFDEAHEVINNDLDFCLRVHADGLWTIYTPHAELIHHELASRANMKDIFDLAQFSRRWWKLYAAGDPFFSPLFKKNYEDFSPDPEAVRAVYAGHPMFRASDIKNILAIKLDHIGDVITAFPALRRLRQIFPGARLHLLAAPAAREFVISEGVVDEVIEFEFFHTRSELGIRNLGDEDFKALLGRLTPYKFDLAVDLRKNLETRDVLRYTAARWLVGYDQLSRFSWLDIALELEESAALQPKRQHVSEDLLRLVDAIGIACDMDRARLTHAAPAGAPLGFLPPKSRKLFAKPVVAIHPGVGQAMRQWPAIHFAALADLLTEKNGVNVVLIGSPDEAKLAEEVLSYVENRDRVVSLVGKTAREHLPALLQACSLYVGNNSGPKHVAAGLGVPTIGIHSGVVDAREWGPVGPRAVALQRDMSCHPCYLIHREDCVRDLMCLNELYPEAVHRYCEMFLAKAS